MTSQLDRRTFTQLIAALLALAAAGTVASDAEAAEPEAEAAPPRSPVPPGHHTVGWFPRAADQGSCCFSLVVGPDGDAVITDKDGSVPAWLLDAIGARLAD